MNEQSEHYQEFKRRKQKIREDRIGTINVKPLGYLWYCEHCNEYNQVLICNVPDDIVTCSKCLTHGIINLIS